MRLDNVGDVIMVGPALRSIKETLPCTRITLMVNPTGAGAAPLLPWPDEVIVWRALWQDLGSLAFDPGREWALVRTLGEGRFDGVIIFTSFSQSPFPAALTCLLAGIPLRLGRSKETAAALLTNAVPPLPDCVHQVGRNLSLVEAVGFPVRDRDLSVRIDERSRQRAEGLLAAAGIMRDEAYLLLNPFASAQARTYPAGPFSEAALLLSERTGLRVVVTGTQKEKGRSKGIVARLGGRGVDLAGMTSVAELAVLVEWADLVLTNDTSTMHLADACGTPAVVLYSGTELESQWRPRRTPHRLLRRPTPCSPCYAFTCPGGLECLDIPPEEVAYAGIDLLSGGSRRSLRRGGAGGLGGQTL